MSTPSAHSRLDGPSPFGRGAWLIAIAGWLGATIHAAIGLHLEGLPRAVQVALLAIATGALVFGALSTASVPEEAEREPWARRIREQVGAGVRRAHLAALPLILLPLTHALPSRAAIVAGCGLALAAIVVLRLRAPEPSSASPRHRTAWQAALLAIALCCAVVYLALSLHTRRNWDNDSAYYFGVARHIVRTGRFEEPLIWHFLSAPTAIHHRPFDYWGGATSLMLVPPLALFGDTFRVASVTMALASSLSLVLFWRLLSVEIALRNPLLEVVALVMFAFTAWMPVTRVDTESIVPFQTMLLSSLLLFARGRFVGAALASFGMILCRTEGVLLCGMLWAACAFAARSDAARLRKVAGAMAACAGVYVAWCLVFFGAPVPPGVRAVATIERHTDMFALVARRPAGPSPWARLTADSPVALLDRVSTQLGSVRLVERQEVWLGFALVAAVGFIRRRPRTEVLVWLLFFAGTFALVWVSPQVTFNAGRSLGTLVPLLVIAGALGADALLARVEETSWRPSIRALVAGACLFAIGYVMLSPVRVYAPDFRPRADSFAELDAILGGEPVASNNPWQIVAGTKSAAVMIPENGEDAIAQVIARHDVRWIVIGSAHAWMHESRAILDGLVSGTRKHIGRYRVTRQRGPSKLIVFRVEKG
jgi:hypothetical protein